MSRIVETYRRMPDGFAFLLAAVASWCLATIAGIAGGLAATYLYDRGNSKGDDVAVLASGLLAVGTFAFVLLFTGLRKLHREISSRTPLSACLFCFTGSLLITGWMCLPAIWTTICNSSSWAGSRSCFLSPGYSFPVACSFTPSISHRDRRKD